MGGVVVKALVLIQVLNPPVHARISLLPTTAKRHLLMAAMRPRTVTLRHSTGWLCLRHTALLLVPQVLRVTARHLACHLRLLSQPNRLQTLLEILRLDAANFIYTRTIFA
jgi:hypothetical protein